MDLNDGKVRFVVSQLVSDGQLPTEPTLGIWNLVGEVWLNPPKGKAQNAAEISTKAA
jgi:hypothetical protein